MDAISVIQITIQKLLLNCYNSNGFDGLDRAGDIVEDTGPPKIFGAACAFAELPNEAAPKPAATAPSVARRVNAPPCPFAIAFLLRSL
jgi:hypothetical protein